MLKLVAGWIYKIFITFLIIVTVLVVGAYICEKLKPVDPKDLAELGSLKAKESAIETNINEFKKGKILLIGIKERLIEKTITRANSLQNATVGALTKRIDAIGSQISVLHGNECSKKDALRHTKKCLISGVENAIREAILEQERDYLIYLVQGASIKIDRQMCDGTLQILKQPVDKINVLLADNQKQQQELRNRHPDKCDRHGTGCNKRLRKLQDEEKRLKGDLNAASSKYQTQNNVCAKIVAIKVKALEISNIDINSKLEKVTIFINDLVMEKEKVAKEHSKLEEQLANQSNIFTEIVTKVKDVTPSALTILASIILLPMAIKAFLYFLIAPRAARRTSNCLMPESSGKIIVIDDLQGKRIENPAVARTIEIAGTDELLIHPDFVLVAPIGGSKVTQWLLDYRFPLSSLASGMFTLTRYRNDSGDKYGIGSANPLYQLAVISLPADSAIVLHPRCLIGMVQRRDHPVTITRHWRLTSLHAWLTLQLRYLVFHGPGTLIVKGCGGVSIEKAAIGRGINQAATIGFSANLSYATSRADPFFAYLSGKQELFNDTFPNGSGYFVYENTPLFGQKSNPITGRGFEGFMDSVFKIFGL